MELPIKDIKALTELCRDSKPGGSPAYRGVFDAIGLTGDTLKQIEDVSQKMAIMTGMYVTETDSIIARCIQQGNLERLRELAVMSNEYYSAIADRGAFHEAVNSFRRVLCDTVDKNAKALHNYLKRFIPKRR